MASLRHYFVYEINDDDDDDYRSLPQYEILFVDNDHIFLFLPWDG